MAVQNLSPALPVLASLEMDALQNEWGLEGSEKLRRSKVRVRAFVCLTLWPVRASLLAVFLRRMPTPSNTHL